MKKRMSRLGNIRSKAQTETMTNKQKKGEMMESKPV
jgi:hypothetical protein